MPIPDPARIRPFDSPYAFYDWLGENHDQPELWLKIYKKYSGIPTVTWAEAITEALCWGWIDGIKKGFDTVSYLQRFSPRKKNSLWSMVNRRDAERLISEGRMQGPGLACVEAARANGRWQNAYLGAAEAETPADFLAAVSADAKARATYDKLSGNALYAIYIRLQTASSEKSRAARFERLIGQLRTGASEL